ncbi:MAG: hypothetical protein BGO70_16975 [Bacteroidetes bacterium 43-93]|nr:S9 family peptidase [Bacteroidota bacterium]OJX01445.1 MAG: hypothetical protein BGO70_16975 [Bacteroidetes bacterium 43-93]
MKYLLLLPLALLSFISYAQIAKKNISPDDLFVNNTFSIKSVPGFNAMKDGRRYTKIDQKDGVQTIRVYDLQTGKAVKEIVTNEAFTENGKAIHIDDYTFSTDETKIMLKSESQNIYRRSVLNKVYIYDIATGKKYMIDDEKVLHATFSPDGSKVAFVKNNNLYYRDLESGKTIAITGDGEKNKIINGNCDWVYEEEFSFTRAFEWAPDNKRIAYYRFDESQVPEYTIPMYTGLYPDNYTYKYPKAGEPNSIIRIRIYNLRSQKTVDAELGKETDQYIPRIKWTLDPKQLCVYRLNRLQNKLEFMLVNATNGESDVIGTDKNKYFVDINNTLEFLPDGKSFIFSSDRSGYTNLYRWHWEKRKLTNLTPFDYDVADLVAVDKEKELVYYTAAAHSPMERKLYSVKWNGRHTETITPEDGTHSITPIEGNHFFLDKYSRLNEPPVYYLRDARGAIIRTLEDNKALRSKMEEYNLGKIRFKKMKIREGEYYNAWMITPPGFDEHKKYPVLMYQYSGPGSQEVADRFPIRDFFWHQMLAEKGYIIVCADGIGTGFRGEEFRKKTYLQLGKLESESQIDVARYLSTLPYVDKDRIGIWGWSFGGFMSSTCIFKGADVFKMAIAVAPVTNWRYYDNIYTERYMRTPAENQAGYDENAPEKMVGKLKGKFLLIHGTADDNVHFQNSVMMVDEMIKANRKFDSEYYPNKTHGISGGNTRNHLYNRMTDFILSNL